MTDRFALDHPARCPHCGKVESDPRPAVVPLRARDEEPTSGAYRETNAAKQPGKVTCFCGHTFTKPPGMHHAYDDEPCDDCMKGICQRGEVPKWAPEVMGMKQKKGRPAKPQGSPLWDGENQS